MNLIRSLFTRPADAIERADPFFTFNGNPYYGLAQPAQYRGEMTDAAFMSLVTGAYKDNGVVFACMLTRLSIFSEARFQFQRITRGRPGDLFGAPGLEILEQPWPNGTTGDLLARMITDADLAGNFFATVRRGQVKRLRPDWVSIIVGSPSDPDVTADDIDAELLGYTYTPGGPGSGRESVPLLPEEVVHFAPIPDPLAWYRGMSWLSPILRETEADGAATSHKLQYFRNGTSPKLVVSFENANMEQVQAFSAKMNAEHAGWENAYKTLYLGAGADVTVAGATLQQLDFKATQGAGETRIAAASGVHPVVAGLSEGLAGSSLNAGNFNSARRLVADRTMRPLWRNAAGCLDPIVPPPPQENGPARLWVDTRDIPFLREDIKDRADVQFVKAQTIKQLVEAGYSTDSVVKAVEAEDMTLLQHSGLLSVQLQEPGRQQQPSLNGSSANGSQPQLASAN